MPQLEISQNPIGSTESRVRDRIDYARSLLNPGFLNLDAEEVDVPIPVQKTIQLLSEVDAWFRITRNHKAESCADAASKRRRLGKVGIPVHAELRTYLGGAIGPDGNPLIVMTHTRGDDELDLKLIEGSLRTRSPIHRLTIEEVKRLNLGMGYGLINPFIGAEVIPHQGKYGGKAIRSPFTQVVDLDVLNSPTVPNTMMTNAGDYTWGVEFCPIEITDLLSPRSREGCFTVEPQASRPAREVNHELSVITGNGPGSGMLLWENINSHFRRLLGTNGNFGDISLPNATIRSLPILGLTMQLDERHEEVWAQLETEIRELIKSRPDVLTIACNTTPYFAPRIKEILKETHNGITSLMTTSSVALNYLTAKGIDRVAIIGIPFVVEHREWSAFLDPFAEVGIEVERLSPKALDEINNLAFLVKTGGADVRSLNQLLTVLKKREIKADTMLIALTEVSEVRKFNKKSTEGLGIEYIDTLDLLGEAIACRLLRKPFGYSAAV